MLRNPLLMLALLPLISGCLAQSRIQEKYISQESTCRDEAENRGNGLPNANGTVGDSNSVQASDTSYIVASTFSDCMHKAGWKVSTPKVPGAPTAPPTTTAGATPVPPSGAPGPGGTVAAKQAPVAQTAPVAPVAAQAPVAAPAPAAQPAPAPQAVPPATPAPSSSVTQPMVAPAKPPSVEAPGAPAAATSSQPASSGISVYQPSDTAVPDYGRSPSR